MWEAVEADVEEAICPHTTIDVLMLLYVCPHTTAESLKADVEEADEALFRF